MVDGLFLSPSSDTSSFFSDSLSSFVDVNFFAMKSGGVLPKVMVGIDLGLAALALASSALADSFILSTVSGLARSFARALIRCSSIVSLVMELSMIF